FDGARVWTANLSGSVSIVTPGTSIPWTVSTVTAGFQFPAGALCDGTSVWISDLGGKLLKVNSSGGVLQTVTVGLGAFFPVFDGANIWVPVTNSNSVAVVRASTGAILQILTGNGLSGPNMAAFNGERILVTNRGNDTVSFWKAADLTPLGTSPVDPGADPNGAASDGLNFWVTLNGTAQLARF